MNCAWHIVFQSICSETFSVPTTNVFWHTGLLPRLQGSSGLSLKSVSPSDTTCTQSELALPSSLFLKPKKQLKINFLTSFRTTFYSGCWVPQCCIRISVEIEWFFINPMTGSFVINQWTAILSWLILFYILAPLQLLWYQEAVNFPCLCGVKS